MRPTSNFKKIAIALYENGCTAIDICNTFEGIISQPTIYRWLHSHTYLDYSYTVEDQLKEWQRIKELPGNYSSIPSKNRIVLSHQPHFYTIERQLYKNPEIRKKLNENRQKYIDKGLIAMTDREILRGMKISGIHMGYSHFSPLWIKKFIEDLDVKCIYDPCGGWGHRLLGVNSIPTIKYIYNDSWSKTVNGCRQIDKFIGGNTLFYNLPCEQFTPREDYDAIFCCPPYYNIEVYDNKKFKSMETYLEWWQQVLNMTKKSSVRYFGLVINHTYKQMLIDEVLRYYSNIIYEEKLGGAQNHFNRSYNVERGEYIIVFSTTLPAL